MMQPIFLHKHTKSNFQSFVIRHAKVPHLYNKWHYHKEIELLYVIKSSGTRFIGDSIQPFFDGDMVLIGSNVPHFWQNDEAYFKDDPNYVAEVVLLQFEEGFMGNALSLPEMLPIKHLFAKALHGIQFYGATKDNVAALLMDIAYQEQENKVIILLQMLDIIAKSEECHLLSDLSYIMKLPVHSSERIQLVCAFLLEHYKEDITLSEVARVANMTEKAFVVSSKKSTQKTLGQFVNELRISHACKLLINHNHSIGEVCYESGFNNLSNFNRIFKRITGQTPSEYQQKKLPFFIVRS
ncbi:MAG: helix-turn-helix transcriptional regulator [Saprospiraceae bacterium]|nr:helix-turn-helix transcriptional regulator [Saprospiraceae bacterium]